MTNRLIIFSKNLVYGKVKTRIASALGPDLAFEIYKQLLAKTVKTISALSDQIEPVIYFSDYIEELPEIDRNVIRREVQSGDDLGMRMANAIQKEIDTGGRKVCLIGSDIYDLTNKVIEKAFEQLSAGHVVIGPAIDGGYYLVGMCESNAELFSNIKWGNSSVLENTIKKIEKADLKYFMLDPLNDVDTYDQVPEEILEIIRNTNS